MRARSWLPFHPGWWRGQRGSGRQLTCAQSIHMAERKLDKLSVLTYRVRTRQFVINLLLSGYPRLSAAMTLPQPRKGKSIGFHVYPSIRDEGMLVDPASTLWTSIRQLCSREVAEGVAALIHGVRRKRDRESVARNLKLYLQQAGEFYEIAGTAKSNTAPLLYYYSFLNLAKAYCELKTPGLHNRMESYHHGVNWQASPAYLVDLEKEEVSVTDRGIWHLLWEAFSGTPCVAANPTRLKVKDLFSYCPEISVEYEKTFGGISKLVDLEDPNIVYDKSAGEAWIRFSVRRKDLRLLRVTAPMLLRQIQSNRSGYTEVQAANHMSRMFQSTLPVKVGADDPVLDAIRDDVTMFNAFMHFKRGQGLQYSVPLQNRLTFRMPQVLVLYSILFWLGSLVRYDPHSLEHLMNSKGWVLMDGFMKKSRLWLLDLFELAFYQARSTIWAVR